MKVIFNFKTRVGNSPVRTERLSTHAQGGPDVPQDPAARHRYDTSLGRVLGLIEPSLRVRLMFAASVRQELRALGLMGQRQVSLADRVRDFGKAQLLAMGAMMTVTATANMFLQKAIAAQGEGLEVDTGIMLVAVSGPVAEKLPMLLSGLTKVPKSFGRHSIVYRFALGATLALPNTITDVLFHDTAYTKLTYEGLSLDAAPDWLVAGTSWGAAFGFAVLAQHAAVWGIRQLRFQR